MRHIHGIRIVSTSSHIMNLLITSHNAIRREFNVSTILRLARETVRAKLTRIAIDTIVES